MLEKLGWRWPQAVAEGRRQPFAPRFLQRSAAGCARIPPLAQHRIQHPVVAVGVGNQRPSRRRSCGGVGKATATSVRMAVGVIVHLEGTRLVPEKVLEWQGRTAPLIVASDSAAVEA